MYRKVMSTHMHTGGGGKQKRMWPDRKKNKARGESNWPGLPGCPPISGPTLFKAWSPRSKCLQHCQAQWMP